jgi:hypothetical protein
MCHLHYCMFSVDYQNFIISILVILDTGVELRFVTFIVLNFTTCMRVLSPFKTQQLDVISMFIELTISLFVFMLT